VIGRSRGVLSAPTPSCSAGLFTLVLDLRRKTD